MHFSTLSFFPHAWLTATKTTQIKYLSYLSRISKLPSTLHLKWYWIMPSSTHEMEWLRQKNFKKPKLRAWQAAIVTLHGRALNRREQLMMIKAPLLPGLWGTHWPLTLLLFQSRKSKIILSARQNFSILIYNFIPPQLSPRKYINTTSNSDNNVTETK